MSNLRIARVVLLCALVLLTGRVAVAQTCSPPGLVAWWPGAGSAIDVTGAHDGTLVGGTTFAPGVVGSAFSFDGNSSIQVPDSPALNPTNAITVEAWINPMLGQSGWPPIIKKDGTNAQSGYALEMAGDRTMCFYVFVRGAGWVGACATIMPGQWMHVAGVYDGRSVTLYVNGLLAASTSYAGTIEPPNGNLGIGLDPTLNRHYKGLIDEPAVFNRALAPWEIAAIYASGSNGHCGALNGLVVHSGSAIYNSGTLSASLFENWRPLAGKPLEFLVQGASVGIGTTDSNGFASVALPSSVNAGFYPGGLSVRFSGDAVDGPQMVDVDLTVYQFLPTITWAQPADMVMGTALSGAQLNATVDAPGMLVYNPPIGTVLLSHQLLTVTFVPSDAQNVASISAEHVVRVIWQDIVSERSAPVAIARIIGGSTIQGSSPCCDYETVNPAIDSLRDVVYVPSADGSIVVADGTTGQTTRTIALDLNGIAGAAGAMALDQVRNRLYVADASQPVIWAVDPVAVTPVVQMTSVPGLVRWLEFNPSTGLLYAVIQDSVTVIVVDPDNPSNLVSIPVGQDVSSWSLCRADSVVVNPVTNLVYVSGCNTSIIDGDPPVGISIIDGDPQRVATFNTIVGGLPPDNDNAITYSKVAVNPRTNRVYELAWTGSKGNLINVYDGDPASSTFHQKLNVISLGSFGALGDTMWPTAIGIDSSRGLVYARVGDWQGNDRGSAILLAVDVTTETVASATTLPYEDQGSTWGYVSVNANTGRIYVTTWRNVTNVFQDARETTLLTETSALPVTVASGQVSLTFTAVSDSGQTTVTQIDPTTLDAMLPGGFTLEGGPAFEISTTATVTAPVQVCFDASWVTDEATFATLVVLHGEGGVLVDRTVSRDFATFTICASVTSLSPFVIARSLEPTYGVVRLYDTARSFKAGSTAPIRLQIADSNGVNLSSASLAVHAIELRQTSTSASSSVVDSGQANADQNFRFDPYLGGSGGYVFNLKTTGLATGSYELRFTVGSGQRQYSVPVQIR